MQIANATFNATYQEAKNGLQSKGLDLDSILDGSAFKKLLDWNLFEAEQKKSSTEDDAIELRHRGESKAKNTVETQETKNVAGENN